MDTPPPPPSSHPITPLNRCSPQPSTSGLSSYAANSPTRDRQKSDSESSSEGAGPLERLLNMFCGQLGAKQVCAVFHALQDDYTASVECLLGKVDLNWIISHLNRLYSKQPIQKIKVDDDELWQDMIIMYIQE